MQNVLIKYNSGGFNVATVKQLLRNFNHMHRPWQLWFKNQILSGIDFNIDGATYSLTTKKTTIL